MKYRDSIINELHRVREDFGRAHDFDVRRIAATIRQHEDENPERLIRELPRPTRRQKKISLPRQAARLSSREAFPILGPEALGPPRNDAHWTLRGGGNVAVGHRRDRVRPARTLMATGLTIDRVAAIKDRAKVVAPTLECVRS